MEYSFKGRNGRENGFEGEWYGEHDRVLFSGFIIGCLGVTTPMALLIGAKGLLKLEVWALSAAPTERGGRIRRARKGVLGAKVGEGIKSPWPEVEDIITIVCRLTKMVKEWMTRTKIETSSEGKVNGSEWAKNGFLGGADSSPSDVLLIIHVRDFAVMYHA